MTIPCPRCAAPIQTPPTDAPATVSCPECGLVMATPYLRETAELGVWHAWAGQRLTWLRDRLLAGDQPSAGETAPPRPQEVLAYPGETAAVPRSTTPAPTAPHRPPASAGSLLLAAGAFLLVVAGIAFLAFTWDLLGPFGQISVLLALGIACLAATDRLLSRMHGTATTLGVVGALLVTIAAIGVRVLGPDLIGPTASLLVAVAILVALCVASAWLRPRTAGVGELAGTAGAVVATLFLLSAPGDDALPLAEPWTWWVAAVTVGAGVLLLLLADRTHLQSWPWVAAVLLVVASLAVAFTVIDLVDPPSDAQTALVVAVMGAGAATVGIGRRALPHPVPLAAALLTVWLLALTAAWASSVFDPANRLWAGVALALTGALAFVPGLFRVTPRGLHASTLLLGGAAIGSAAGLLVAPWVDPWDEYLTAVEWASQAMPAWRGLVSGLTVVGVLVAAVVWTPAAVRSVSATASAAEAEVDVDASGPDVAMTGWMAALPLVPAAAALATWLMAVTSDLGEVTQRGLSPAASFYTPQPTPDAFLHQVSIALAVVAVGVLASALVRRLPAWAVWIVPVLAIPALLVELSTRALDTDWRPELVGLVIATPALIASVAWRSLQGQARATTWLTIAPPLVLVLLPSTLTLIEASADRWLLAGDVDATYQTRTVVLLVVGAAAAIVGARQRWAGLFFPGLAVTLVVVGVQLVDLGRFLPQWVSFGVAGVALVAAGARWEWVRDRGRSGAAWVRTMR